MTIRQNTLGPLIVAAILGTVGCIYWPTAHQMILRHDAHRPVTFVLAAFAFMVWDSRATLSKLQLRPFYPGLIGLIGLGSLWLIGHLVFARILNDIALVGMIAMTVLSVLGHRWLSTLAFPLAVLFLAIPIAGQLVPILVDWTAEYAVMGLLASGVPIHQEGAFFVIPTGSWSVAESCSGMEYFSTCVMLGCLYAWRMYDSGIKRVLFVAGSAVISVVGNWIRVYLTVLVAHITENRFLRDDHSTFGWIVFATMLLGYGWLGLRFRDGALQEPATMTFDIDSSSLGMESRKFKVLPVVTAAVVALAALVVWPQIETRMAQQQKVRLIEIADIAPRNGWAKVEASWSGWTPVLQNPSRTRVQTFEKAGQRIDVFIGIFQNQTWESKLVTSANQFTGSANQHWKQVERGVMVAKIAGRSVEVETGIIDGYGNRIVSWRWYWIDGVVTANGPKAKFRQLLGRLQGNEDTAAWIAIYADANQSAEAATSALSSFVQEMSGALEQALLLTVH